MKIYKRLFFAAAFCLALSCRVVKQYQRAYLNDHAMQIGKQSAQKLSSAVHTYKEGASGGGSGKNSGGCGCN